MNQVRSGKRKSKFGPRSHGRNPGSGDGTGGTGGDGGGEAVDGGMGIIRGGDGGGPVGEEKLEEMKGRERALFKAMFAPRYASDWVQDKATT